MWLILHCRLNTPKVWRTGNSQAHLTKHLTHVAGLKECLDHVVSYAGDSHTPWSTAQVSGCCSCLAPGDDPLHVDITATFVISCILISSYSPC